MPTVARYLVAGRPLPRVEDTIRFAELMRLAALAKFGWDLDEATGWRTPRAPWQISGRRADGQPVKDPEHSHAFWLPEDADDDGRIDHVSVYVPGGMDADIQSKLDRITRLWVPRGDADSEGGQDSQTSTAEWRLALEGFGDRSDFAAGKRTGGAQIFGTSSRWRSATPFLAAGHLKSGGYRTEVLRLLARRGWTIEGVEVEASNGIEVGGTLRDPSHFHRFRSRGREKQFDTAGAMLRITFPNPVSGPVALGFGSHFGLGLFIPDPVPD